MQKIKVGGEKYLVEAAEFVVMRPQKELIVE